MCKMSYSFTNFEPHSGKIMEVDAISLITTLIKSFKTFEELEQKFF